MTPTVTRRDPDHTPPVPSLADYLLAEAVRLHEEHQGAPLNEPAAIASAQSVNGDLPRRIIARSHALSLAPSIQQTLLRFRRIALIVVGCAMILALAAGATATSTALSTAAQPVNFFWAWGSLLALPTLTLVLWLALITARPQALADSSLGGWLLAISQRLGQHFSQGPAALATLQAITSTLLGTRLGRWTLSLLSHSLWLAFSIGCMLTLVINLGIRDYVFTWETTIFSEAIYVPLTRSIAFLPDQFGFASPDAAAIYASRRSEEHSPDAAAAKAWSSLLIGSVLVYGLLPRLVLMILCLALMDRARKRLALDIDLPGYTRLQADLYPTTRTLGVVDAERPTSAPAPPAVTPTPPKTSHRQRGDEVALLGVELAPPEEWPPTVNGISWSPLGFADDRQERQRILKAIEQTEAIGQVVVVCSLANTPDRGSQAFLQRLQSEAELPITLLLSQGQRLRQRPGADVGQRVADWRSLAEAAGIPDGRVLTIDLDHLTAESRRRLTETLHESLPDTPANDGRQLTAAFDHIKNACREWNGPPDPSTQAALHRAIADLYRHQHNQWPRVWQKPFNPHTSLDQLRSGAQQMVDLLPARLRRSPRWLAAGAMAGALGCVTAATLLTPAAITALPLWAGMGGLMSLVVGGGESTDVSPETPPPAPFTDAITSAALFSLVLELQGQDETKISHILDQVVEDDNPDIIDAATAATWLDHLHHRFRLTVASC